MIEEREKDPMIKVKRRNNMKKLLSVFFVLIFMFSITNGKTHTVKKGDTLWGISGFYLNNPFLWPEIYELNKDKIEDPHWIYPGQIFKLPIPGNDNTASIKDGVSNNSVASTSVENTQTPQYTFKKVKLTDLNKRFSGKELSIAWLKAKRMIQGGDYIELFHIPNNVSYMGLYYGGFITNKNIDKGRITGILGDNSMVNSAVKFDRVKINLGKSKVKKGEKLTVFSYGKNIRTGEKTGRIIKIYGTLKVLKTFDNYSICVVTGNRVVLTKGLLITDLWTPPFIPDFDMAKAKSKIYARIIGYRDKQTVIKDYNVAYINKGSSDGFVQGDKFNIVDAKGNVHGAIQLLWVGKNFSTGYVIRTGDINMNKYKTVELAMKSLPKGHTRFIKKVPVEKVTEQEVTKSATVKTENTKPTVINEESEAQETPKISKESAVKTTIEEKTKIIGDTVKSDSNATVIVEKPETTKTVVPVVEKQPTGSDTTSPVIEEQPTGSDTTSSVIEEQPTGSDTTSPVIEEQPADTTDTTSSIIEQQAPSDSDTTTVIEEGN